MNKNKQTKGTGTQATNKKQTAAVRQSWTIILPPTPSIWKQQHISKPTNNHTHTHTHTRTHARTHARTHRKEKGAGGRSGTEEKRETKSYELWNRHETQSKTAVFGGTRHTRGDVWKENKRSSSSEHSQGEALRATEPTETMTCRVTHLFHNSPLNDDGMIDRLLRFVANQR